MNNREDDDNEFLLEFKFFITGLLEMIPLYLTLSIGSEALYRHDVKTAIIFYALPYVCLVITIPLGMKLGDCIYYAFKEYKANKDK